MRNLLTSHLTHWRWWYSILALVALIVGSFAGLATIGLPAQLQAWLAAPLPMLAFAVIALLLVAIAARRWPRREDLALQPLLTLRQLGVVLAMFVITHGIFWLLSLGANDPNQAQRLFADMNLGQGVASDISVLLAAVILAPVCEELLYRGVLMRSIHDDIARRGWSRLAVVVAVAASAITFAMPHLGDDATWRIIVAYLITGVSFSLVYVWTGSLTAAMLAHALQSTYAFGSILLFGRGDAQVSLATYVLVFGTPVWVYVLATLLYRLFPSAARGK